MDTGSDTPLLAPPPAPALSSDSYAQRAAVRAALSQDPSWISEYISKALPMLRSQENQVVYLVPWSQLKEPLKEGGKPQTPLYTPDPARAKSRS